ncbi:unnamed protein product, partial [Polarella glacialis]
VLLQRVSFSLHPIKRSSRIRGCRPRAPQFCICWPTTPFRSKGFGARTWSPAAALKLRLCSNDSLRVEVTELSAVIKLYSSTLLGTPNTTTTIKTTTTIRTTICTLQQRGL